MIKPSNRTGYSWTADNQKTSASSPRNASLIANFYCGIEVFCDRMPRRTISIASFSVDKLARTACRRCRDGIVTISNSQARHTHTHTYTERECRMVPRSSKEASRLRQSLLVQFRLRVSLCRHWLQPELLCPAMPSASGLLTTLLGSLAHGFSLLIPPSPSHPWDCTRTK